MSRSKKATVEPTTAADVVRRRVRELRKARGWSAQKLADRLHELDPTTAFERPVLTNFELGRRANVTIDEVLLLAYVLDESPLALLVPYPDEPPVQVGSVVVEPWRLTMWAIGDSPLAGQDELAFESSRAAARILTARPGVPDDGDPLGAARHASLIAEELDRALARLVHDLEYPPETE